MYGLLVRFIVYHLFARFLVWIFLLGIVIAVIVLIFWRN